LLEWLLAAIGGAILSQLVEIFLPERIRIAFALRKKLLSKWFRNPSYTIGITSLLEFKEPLELTVGQARLRELYSSHNPTGTGTELHFQEIVGHAQINTKIQLSYEENKQLGVLALFSINITVDVQAQYRDIRSRIEDLRAALSAAETVPLKSFSVFPAKRALYIEVDRLEEFSEWLENLEAQQISGKLKNAEAEFVYHDRRLVIEDTINSATISWLKNILAHVG